MYHVGEMSGYSQEPNSGISWTRTCTGCRTFVHGFIDSFFKIVHVCVCVCTCVSVKHSMQRWLLSTLSTSVYQLTWGHKTLGGQFVASRMKSLRHRSATGLNSGLGLAVNELSHGALGNADAGVWLGRGSFKMRA